MILKDRDGSMLITDKDNKIEEVKIVRKKLMIVKMVF